jgi:hypothetical protein
MEPNAIGALTSASQLQRVLQTQPQEPLQLLQRRNYRAPKTAAITAAAVTQERPFLLGPLVMQVQSQVDAKERGQQTG